MPSSTTSSNHTLSPSSTLIAGDDDVGHYSEIEFVEGVPYTRKRPSTSQVDALQASYELNRYPTREERRELANRVGMQYSAVTNWFQNRRQSHNRKAWSIADRAKKRARAREASQRPSLMAGLSLDQVASLLERRSSSPSTTHSLSSSSIPFTPTKRRTMSPAELVDHMQSSPPAPSPSPTRERLIRPSGPIKPIKSLEWACAKDRLDRKLQQRDKENRPARVRKLGGHLKPIAAVKSARPRVESAPELGRKDIEMRECETEEDSDTEVEPEEALTPGRQTGKTCTTTPSLSRGLIREDKDKMTTPEPDMEAAMMLLGFKTAS